MFLETCDEGTLQGLNDHGGQWLDVGTPLGTIVDDDEEEVDGDWIWQAYLHDEKE